MLTRLVVGVVVMMAAALPTVVTADAEKHEWLGTWSMNTDGNVASLRIRDLKADCVSPVWCDMAIEYTDNAGTTHRGKILALDSRMQHMRFEIRFPQYTQRFDAYLFSWDKSKMAGTTEWNRRPFGFFATKP